MFLHLGKTNRNTSVNNLIVRLASTERYSILSSAWHKYGHAATLAPSAVTCELTRCPLRTWLQCVDTKSRVRSLLFASLHTSVQTYWLSVIGSPFSLRNRKATRVSVRAIVEGLSSGNSNAPCQSAVLRLAARKIVPFVRPGVLILLVPNLRDDSSRDDDQERLH